MADITIMPRRQEYIFSNPTTPTSPVSALTEPSSTGTNYISLVDVYLRLSDELDEYQLVIEPIVGLFLGDHLQVEFNDALYEIDQGESVQVVVAGPFPDPVGIIRCRIVNSVTGIAWQWSAVTPAPFFIPDPVPRWGNLVHSFAAYLDAQDLFHGFYTGANRSFGFGSAVDRIELWSGDKTSAIKQNPDLTWSMTKDESAFLPEIFNQGTSEVNFYGGELGIRAYIYDENDLQSTYNTLRFFCHEANPIQRENTQYYVPGHSPVNRVNIIIGGNVYVRSTAVPLGFKVNRIITSTNQLIDHYEINFAGTILMNYMLPSSVWMPDNTWRLLAFNRAEKRYEIFASTITSEAGGFMNIVWGTGYHAAHMTRLIDGTLCTMAWTYNSDDQHYYLWFKRSFDDGATWDTPTLIDSFNTTSPGPSFSPAWVIVQDYRTGTVVIGDYYSDDMGHSWHASLLA